VSSSDKNLFRGISCSLKIAIDSGRWRGTSGIDIVLLGVISTTLSILSSKIPNLLSFMNLSTLGVLFFFSFLGTSSAVLMVGFCGDCGFGFFLVFCF
jgi:hypothetical protein